MPRGSRVPGFDAGRYDLMDLIAGLQQQRKTAGPDEAGPSREKDSVHCCTMKSGQSRSRSLITLGSRGQRTSKAGSFQRTQRAESGR